MPACDLASLVYHVTPAYVSPVLEAGGKKIMQYILCVVLKISVRVRWGVRVTVRIRIRVRFRVRITVRIEVRPAAQWSRPSRRSLEELRGCPNL